MRKFSAHRIYPVCGPPVNFGIIETTDEGTILNIREAGGPIEESGLEFYSGIIIPGLVNAHCHLELSHLAGKIPMHTGITQFVSEISGIRDAGDATIREAAERADRMMYREGISGAGDISNTGITLGIKQNSPIRYHTFLELFGLNKDIGAIRFNLARELSELFNKGGQSCTLSPHAPYSLGTGMWEMVSAAEGITGRISMHHDESRQEREMLLHRSGIMADEFTRSGFDLSQLPEEAHDVFRLLGKYLPGSEWLLVHNTITDPVFAAQGGNEGIYWVLCPRSNRYIENQLPDLEGFARSGLTICLGTDSLASNHSLSVLEEMKTIREAAPGISFDTVLRWATINGATALGMENNLGTLEPGKTPGLVNIPVFDWGNNRLHPDSRSSRLI